MTPDEIRNLVATQLNAARALREVGGMHISGTVHQVQTVDSTILLAEIAAQLAELNLLLKHSALNVYTREG
jgi:hypothetical protein